MKPLSTQKLIQYRLFWVFIFIIGFLIYHNLLYFNNQPECNNTHQNHSSLPQLSYEEYKQQFSTLDSDYGFLKDVVNKNNNDDAKSSAGFNSRYAKNRSVGKVMKAMPGAVGSTSHCYLHPLLNEFCAPYFICIGAQKAGTQSFLNWIGMHPQVRVAKREAHFWDYGGVGRTLADYFDDLPLVKPRKRTNDGLPIVVGEKTPRYIGEASPLSMYQALPELRLLLLVRDPIQRAFSHYLHLRRRADETWRERNFPFDSFEAAIRHSLFQFNALHSCGNPLHLPLPSLLQCLVDHPRPVSIRELSEHPADMLVRGLYAPLLQRWTPFYALGSQLLIVNSDDLFHSPSNTMNQITEFLNISTIDWQSIFDVPKVDSNILNQKADQAERALALLGKNITWQETALLQAFYAPYNHDFSNLIHRTPA